MVRMPLAVVAGAMLIAAAAQAGPTLKGAPQHHLTPGPAQTEELTAAIAKADAALFHEVFVRCDPITTAAMLTDDFRFVHDKEGEQSRVQFIRDLNGHCRRLKSGEDFAARRELVEGSLEVWPINKYGALEIGTHRFYAQLRGKPEQLTETGRFMILWKKEGSDWKMAEITSAWVMLRVMPSALKTR
ncbi:MAG: nuclear transport factor 2 family protein [Alphaproteobacteria bacterium]|nr:nuclear transport factor 2 family protein [Alphaproteobacteria bacterium]